MKFCAFLRGVNIGGSVLKMADVCKVFTDAGMENVSSVLATGNILFSSERHHSELKVILEKAMPEYFNYEAFLFIKAENEVNEIFKNVPFQTAENFHCYAFVGIDRIEEILLDKFRKVEHFEEEKAEIVNGIFYWQIVKGKTLESNFGKILGKKCLKDKLTSRNINTFEKILKKMQL